MVTAAIFALIYQMRRKRKGMNRMEPGKRVINEEERSA